jgi:hypothetical protein
MIQAFAVGAYPQGPIPRLEDAPNHVVREAFLLAKVTENAIAEFNRSTLRHADPQMSFTVREYLGYVVRRKTLTSGVGEELSLVQRSDSTVIKPDPKCPATILDQRGDLVV